MARTRAGNQQGSAATRKGRAPKSSRDLPSCPCLPPPRTPPPAPPEQPPQYHADAISIPPGIPFPTPPRRPFCSPLNSLKFDIAVATNMQQGAQAQLTVDSLSEWRPQAAGSRGRQAAVAGIAAGAGAQQGAQSSRSGGAIASAGGGAGGMAGARMHQCRRPGMPAPAHGQMSPLLHPPHLLPATPTSAPR
jgi:hypothetical protein